jgi:hypothetical protein
MDHRIDIDPTWLHDFDAAMKKFFAIDHVDAGMDCSILARYSDLPAQEAAMQFGEDYDLQRIDTGWR